MQQQMNDLDWPPGYDRTPSDDREPYPGNITVSHKKAFQSIKTELARWGAVHDRTETATTHYANDPDIPHKSSDPDDPGVAVYFRREGEHADSGYAIACDRWDSLRDNARAIALYVKRKRLAERCGVATAESEFSTAALPSGEEDEDVVVAGAGRGAQAPHEVLGVRPDAPAAVVRGAARSLKAEHHPDSGGDTDQFKRVVEAEEAMLDGT